MQCFRDMSWRHGAAAATTGAVAEEWGGRAGEHHPAVSLSERCAVGTRLVPWLLQEAHSQQGPLVTVACSAGPGNSKGIMAKQRKGVLLPPELQGILTGHGLLSHVLSLSCSGSLCLRGLSACILCTVYFTAHFPLSTACTVF